MATQEPGFNTGNLTMYFIATGILFFAWYLSKRRVVSIRSNGGKPLEFYTKGISEEEIYNMLEKIQLAKTERLNETYKL